MWLHPTLSCLPLPPALDTALLSPEEEHRSVYLPRRRKGSVVSGEANIAGRSRRRRGRVMEAVKRTSRTTPIHTQERERVSLRLLFFGEKSLKSFVWCRL